MKTFGIQLVAELHGCSPTLLNDAAHLESILSQGIKKCGLHEVGIKSHRFDPIGVTVISIISESHVALHTYPEAHHASVDIFHCSDDSAPLFELLNVLKVQLKAASVKFMEVARGSKLEFVEDNYITSPASYGFEVRYYFTKMLVSRVSQYHRIEVVENENFGRMLFLDGDLQIAEKDVHLYNEAMVAPLRQAAKLDRVAILGGGDGGVLNEVLKLKPGRVALVDIDGEVIEVAKEFFRTVCGDAFDRRNVEVVVGDANEFLERESGFDGVIYDLTMDPELLTNKDKYQFMHDLFAKIHRSMNPGGIFSMQCCSQHDTRTLGVVKEVLSAFFAETAFRTVFIPSYCEPWIFGSGRKA